MKIDGISTLNMQKSVTYNKEVSEDQAFEEMLINAYSDGDKEKLKKACKDFEGILIGMMYKQMKKTVPENKFFPKSYAREMFEEMLDDEIINNAKETGLGIADVLYRQLSANLDRIYNINSKDSE
ncbi:MAG TPA: rod-binding protein [Thermoclostridium sp.]